MTPKKNTLGASIIQILEKIEDLILIGLLLLMIFMAVLQIALRNIFESGIFWADPLIRILVLWIGLIGAMVASRHNHHISIDVISRYLPGQAKKIASLIISTFTATICGVMAYFSFIFVQIEYQDHMIAFGSIPVWLCETIIPISFTIISIRYIVFSFATLKDLFSKERK